MSFLDESGGCVVAYIVLLFSLQYAASWKQKAFHNGSTTSRVERGVSLKKQQRGKYSLE
jgi:hypothetical protein